jgi:hypothetical protein
MSLRNICTYLATSIHRTVMDTDRSTIADTNTTRMKCCLRMLQIPLKAVHYCRTEGNIGAVRSDCDLMGKLCWLEQCSFAEQQVFMFPRISLESACVYRPYHFSDRKVSPCLDQPLVSLRVSQMVKTWFLVLGSSWTVFSVKHEVSWVKVEC